MTNHVPERAALSCTGIEMISDRLQCVCPMPLRRLGTASKADGDLSPAISLGTHPHQMTLLHFEPEHPLHRLEHALNVFWTGRKGTTHRFIGRVRFPLAARKGRPRVEVALDSNRRQAPRSDCSLKEACRDIVKGPGYAGPLDGRIEASEPIHDAALPCRTDAHRCVAPVGVHRSQDGSPQH